MFVGVLREIKDGEARVALTPAEAKTPVEKEHRVFIASRAGGW